LSTHYRQQFNFTFEGLNAAKSALDRLKNLRRRLYDAEGNSSEGRVAMQIQCVRQSFGDAMSDDLNISIALAALFDFVREINNLLDTNVVSKEAAKEVLECLLQFNSVLGIMDNVVETKEPLPSDIDALVQKREEARRAKNWKEADTIRGQLKALGIVIEDTSQGIRWHKQ